MDDRRIRTNEDIERLAGELHEKVRALNHLTLAPPGLTGPAVAYTVLGNLAQTAFRFVQTAEQIDACLTRELDAGHLGHDRGDDPAAAVTTVHDVLARAAEQAMDLGETFRRASGALLAIHGRDVHDHPSLEEQAGASLIEQHEAQLESAREDFPKPIDDALPGQTPDGSASSESRPSSPLPHPRRER